MRRYDLFFHAGYQPDRRGGSFSDIRRPVLIPDGSVVGVEAVEATDRDLLAMGLRVLAWRAAHTVHRRR
jgi:hypothetical protein